MPPQSQFIMLDQLFSFMNSIRPLTEGLKEVLLENMEIIEVAPKHVLLKDGETSDHIYVVIKRLLRMYYITDGVEVCSRFMAEQSMAMAVTSFYTRKPGYEFIETLEPCVLARISFDRLQKIYNEQDNFNYIARGITEAYFMRSEERLYLIRKKSAEDRYLYLGNHYPEILQRVPLSYIASYLCMTPETLSRIRKRLSKK